MPVIPMWQCGRDGKMFEDKKSAEEYERMLELAANIAKLLKANFDSMTDDLTDEIGVFIAKNKEVFIKAFKGKPDVLTDPAVGQTSVKPKGIKQEERTAETEK